MIVSRDAETIFSKIYNLSLVKTLSKFRNKHPNRDKGLDQKPAVNGILTVQTPQHSHSSPKLAKDLLFGEVLALLTPAVYGK